ncbi:L-2-amino-thiazoline-4-carboxylic acid hydrolase [Roseivivax sp. CAU 1753]
MFRSDLPHQPNWKRTIALRLDRQTAERIWVTTCDKYLEIASAEKHPAAAKIHLDVILPSIAFHLSAREIGLPSDASLSIVKSVAMRNAKPKAGFMKVLKYLPGAFWLFRIISPRVLKRDFAKAGFEVEWIENNSTSIAFDINKCLYVDLFGKYDCLDIAPIFCGIDDYWYEPLAPTINWKRAGTLAKGACCCDFRFSNGSSTFDPPSKPKN